MGVCQCGSICTEHISTRISCVNVYKFEIFCSKTTHQTCTDVLWDTPPSLSAMYEMGRRRDGGGGEVID